jgi:toxin ParE1/3/4
MARVTVSRAANEQLRVIHAYIAQDSRAAAARTLRRIRAGIRTLVAHPRQGRAVPEYEDPAVRELIIAPFRVMYRYNAERNHVDVIWIYHGSQLLPPMPPDV